MTLTKRWRRRASAALLLLLAAGTSPCAYADDADDLLSDIDDITDLDLAELLGTVESASNMPEARATAPAAVSVLEREDIEATGATALPDLIKSIPGLKVVHVSPGISLVSLRGLGGLQANNLVVLVDGVRVNSPIDGTVDWEHITVPVEHIERIEVVRGPVSAIYGSDAYAGLVHIISRRERNAGLRPAGSVHQGFDDRLALNRRAFVGLGFRKEAIAIAAMAQARSDATWSYEAEGDDALANVSSASGRVGTRLYLGRTEAALHLDGATSRRAWVDHLVLTPTPMDSDEASVATELLSRSDGLVSKIELDTSHRVLRMQTPPNVEVDGFTYAGTAGREGHYTLGVGLVPLDALSFGLGAEAGWEVLSAPYLHPDESGVPRARYGASASVRGELGKLVLSGSVRGDLSSRFEGAFFSGRASATWVEDTFTLRGSVGSSFREPSYVELGARLVDPGTNLILLEGAPDFAPPRLEAAEIGVIAAPHHALTIEPVAYLQRARDLAVLDFEPLVKKTFRNDNDDVVISGLELDLRWNPLPFTSVYTRGAWIAWLSERTDTSATVGVDEQNPNLELWLGGRSAGARVEAYLQMGVVGPRSFATQAGMPPQLLFADIPTTTPIEGAIHLRLLDDTPLFFWVRGDWQPQGAAEFPIPAAGVPGVRGFLGLELRREEY